MKINVATIGFTKSTAEHFFARLKQAEVRQVMDVRLHNTSQLAGFAKAEDLAYFLRELCGADYTHQPLLAPTDEILKGFKQAKGAWDLYQKQFMQLMAARRIEKALKPAMFDRACLLCSEATPHHCHRQLVCTYLNGKWGGTLSVTHL